MSLLFCFIYLYIFWNKNVTVQLKVNTRKNTVTTCEVKEDTQKAAKISLATQEAGAQRAFYIFKMQINGWK